MRRLLWLLVALSLAGYGFGLIAGADAFWPYLVRDGLLLATAGGLIFAWHSGSLPAPELRRRAWPAVGQLLLATAFACSLAATAVLMLLGSQGWPAWMGGSLWVIALGLWAVALLWPGVADYAPPAYRWTRDAAGNLVRLALEGESAEPMDALDARRHRLPWVLLLVLAVGWVLRLWRLAALPLDCLDVECAQALQLVDGSWWRGMDASSTGLHTLLAALLYWITGSPLLALRGAAALLAGATLPIFYWAARAYTRPTGAVLGLTLLALSPWHLWASRAGDAWVAAPLLLLIGLGAAARGLQSRDARWWGVAGGSLGLLMAQPLPLQSVTLVFVVVTGLGAWLLSWVERKPESQAAWVMLGSALVVGLPMALPAWRGLPAGALSADSSWWTELAALLFGGGTPLALFLHGPLLPPFMSALAVSGLLTLTRAWRRPAALLLPAGFLFYLSSMGTTAARLPGLGLLAILPFLFLSATVALNQLVTAFDRAWARLIPLPRTLLVGVILLAALLAPDVLALQRQWRTPLGGQNALEVAMGRYLVTCITGQVENDPCSDTGEHAPIFFVPPAVLAHPSTQLLLGSAPDAARVRPLDVGRDLLPALDPPGDLVYLVAIDDQPLIDLFQQLHPSAQAHAEPQDPAGPALFLVYTIAREDVLARQGLAGTYSTEPSAGETGKESGKGSGEIRRDGPLAFAWGDAPPRAAPFAATWEGSLLLPVAGTYHFQVQGIAPQAVDPVVSMQLDGRLLLDSSLGLMEQSAQLAQGYVRLTLHYRTQSAPGDWAIEWQPPTGRAEPIPRQVLVSPPLPTIGLVGTYRAGDDWQGPVLMVRTDLLLGAPVDLPPPYSVVWRGKLAVPRAGETFFAVTANGPVQLAIAGQPLLDYLPSAQLGEGPSFSQASIYLERGWQEIELRYAPQAEIEQGETDLRILWQPPGSGPMNLLSRYLLPSTAEVTTGDVPLPPTSELIDARLGDDRFALTTSMEVYQPGTTLPPQNLPPLLADLHRQVGSVCGADASQFDLPHGLALDAARGRLYVADTGNARVVAVELETGAFAEVYGVGALQEPVDVELAPDGGLLVLDALAAALVRVDLATGETAPLALQTGFYRPRGLGVDPSGVIAVADTGGGRVVLLDASGAVLAQFGGPATFLGQGQPVDAMAANGQLWTVTAENGRLWRLDVLGSLAALPRSNTLDGPQLAALPDGTFFLSSPTGRTVLYHAASGQPLGQVAHGGSLVTPTGVAAGEQAGELLLAIADSATCQVTLWQVRVE